MSRRLRAALADAPSVARPSSASSPGRASSPGLSSIADPSPASSPVPGVMMPEPLVLDLVAALVHGGAAPRTALGSVATALRTAGDPRADDLLQVSLQLGHPRFEDMKPVASEPESESRLVVVLADALALAARSGLPPTALIRRSAIEERRRLSVAQLRAIRRLEVLLVVPAGLCLLPAFILLGVVPVVLDLIIG